MSRSTKPFLKILALLGVAGGILAATPSCRDNNETIFVRQIPLPAAPDCVAKADPSAEFITRGTLDIALSTRYLINALIGNQLVARGDFKQARSEPNRVLIKGADIHLVNTSSGQDQFYSVSASGEIDPQSNGDATYGLAGFELIPPGIGAPIHDQLLASLQGGRGAVQSFEARFKIFGTTLGGTDVETGEYVFDVDVCYGCTVIFPSDSFDPTVQPNKINCKKAGSATTTTTGGQTPACIAGQDGVTDCRNCQGIPVCTPCITNAECTTAGTGTTCVDSHCI